MEVQLKTLEVAKNIIELFSLRNSQLITIDIKISLRLPN